MKQKKKIRHLEETILFVQQKGKSAPLSVEKIIELLEGKGQLIIILLLCLPFCQPLQVPGSSTPFGLAIAFISLRMALKKRFWLPKRFLSKNISSKTLEKITNFSIKLIRKIKFLIHPRLEWFCHNMFMKNMNLWLIFLLGIFLALPLPIPFSNLTAAWAIFLVSIGMVEDDGVFVLLSYLMCLLTIGFLIGLSFAIESIQT